MRRVLATGVATAALVLAGCTGSAPGPAAATTLPDGVEVELFQLRSDVAERGAQIRVVNGSDADLVVSRLVFTDDWFDGEAVRDRVSTIAAGRTVDLRIALPESACEGEPDAGARTSSVSFEFTTGRADDESTAVAAEATVAITDPLGFTTFIHEKECLRHDLAQVLALEWASFTPSVAPLPAELILAVTPSGDADAAGAASLTDVQTTNLLQFADQPTPFPLDLEVAPMDAASRVVIPLLPLRCDPHAVMEDKRGTVFNVAVQVDGVAGVVEVAAPEAMRGEILRWVSDWCGFGPGG